MIQSIFSFFFFCQRLIVRTSVDQTTSVTVNNLTVLLCNNQVKAGGQCRLDLRPYFFGVTAHLNEYVHIKEVQMFLTLFLFYLCCLLFNAKPPPPQRGQPFLVRLQLTWGTVHICIYIHTCTGNTFNFFPRYNSPPAPPVNRITINLQCLTF